MVNSLQDLRQLIDLLGEKGVVSFRHGDLEMTIAPQFAQLDVQEEPSEEEPVGWRGLTREELIDLGVQ